MATYLNPDSDALPCMDCGRDVSGLVIQSLHTDVSCQCGAPVVVGFAFGVSNHPHMGARLHA